MSDKYTLSMISTDYDESQNIAVHSIDEGRIASVSLGGDAYINTTDLL